MAVPVRRKESVRVRVMHRVDERMGTVEYGLANVNEEQKVKVKRFEVGMHDRLSAMESRVKKMLTERIEVMAAVV